MALFKIFKGDSSLLDSQHIHEGYCYLTTDEKKLYVDISDSQRIVLNSEAASKIQTADGQELSIEEIFKNNNNIFIALPDITTPSQVQDALDDGKMIFVKDDNNIYYPLVAIAGSDQNITYIFDTLVGNNRSGYNLISNTGEWRSVSALLATLESPVFTGRPEAPLPTDTSNKNQIVNIGFVEQQIRQVQQPLPAGLLKGSGSVDASGNLNDPTIYQAIEYKDYFPVRGTYPQSLSLSTAGESSQQFTYAILSDSFTNLKSSLGNLIDKLPQGTLRIFRFYVTHENIPNFFDTPFYREPEINGGQGFIVEIFKSLSSNITNLTFRVYYGGGCRWIYAARDNSGQWKNFDQSSGLSSFHYFDENTQVLKPKKVVNNKEVDINVLGWDSVNQKLVDNGSKVILNSNIVSEETSSSSKVYSTNYVNGKLNAINNTISTINNNIDGLETSLNNGLSTKVSTSKISNAYTATNDNIYNATYINSLTNRSTAVTAATKSIEPDTAYRMRGEAIDTIDNYENYTITANSPKKGQIVWFYG